MPLIHAEQAHHKARRAKAALRRVALHHRFLRGVQAAVGRGQVFYRPQRHAVNRMRQPDAAVDGAKAQRAAFNLAQHDSASAAVAFGATLFGAGQPQVFAQQRQQRAIGWYIAEIDDFAPSDKADGFDRMLNG